MKLVSVCFMTIHLCYGILNETLDLGYGFDENTLYFPGMPTFQLSDVAYVEDPYFRAKKFNAAEHGGTHLDAPYHFNPNGWKVAEIPLERLLVPGVVVNKREAAARDRDAQLTQQDLIEWEQTYGELPDPVAVIVNFGWAKKYPNKADYFGTVNGNESDLHFPGLSEDAANWLVNTGKVVGVGIDTASIDPGFNTEYDAHRVLTAANIYLMENLALDGKDLPPRGFQLIIMPMKIKNGTGAPLRIVACPESLHPTIFVKLMSLFNRVWITITSVFK